MAARKRETAPAPSAQEFTIVLEDLRSQFKVFGEALGALGEKVDSLEQKVDRLEEKVDRGFEQVDRRFEQVDRRLETLECDMKLVKTAILDQHRELATKVSRDELEEAVERAVARSGAQ